MRLLGLEAKNIKILKAVNIDFKKNGVVYISGKNNQGKSTVIDLIHIALAGKSHYKDQSKMRNKDASEDDEAFVIADLDEYKVKRWFTASGNDYIEIVNNDDIKQGSPETLLQKFYSDHCRNPQEMAEMGKDEQVNFIYKLMDIEEAIEELDEEYDEIYMNRRDNNRDLKKAKGHLESLEEPEEELPEKVDVSKTSKKLTKAQEFNNKIDQNRQNLETLKSNKPTFKKSIETQKDKIQETEAEIERLKKRLKQEKEELSDKENKLSECKESIKSTKKWLDENEEIDTEPLQDKIDKAEEINELHDKAEEYKEAQEKVEELQEVSDNYTEELEQIDAKKDQLLKDNKLPIDGVTIEDGELHKEGIPVSQLSTTESIKFWSKLYVATDPRLRLMTLHRGESLDSDNQKELEAFAEEHDILFIVEMVDESQKTGVVIENGQIIENNS